MRIILNSCLIALGADRAFAARDSKPENEEVYDPGHALSPEMEAEVLSNVFPSGHENLIRNAGANMYPDRFVEKGIEIEGCPYREYDGYYPYDIVAKKGKHGKIFLRFACERAVAELYMFDERSHAKGWRLIIQGHRKPKKKDGMPGHLLSPDGMPGNPQSVDDFWFTSRIKGQNPPHDHPNAKYSWVDTGFAFQTHVPYPGMTVKFINLTGDAHEEPKNLCKKKELICTFPGQIEEKIDYCKYVGFSYYDFLKLSTKGRKNHMLEADI